MLSKDGFKKFMKYDACHYPECRYSKVSNHIHCVRPGSVFAALKGVHSVLIYVPGFQTAFKPHVHVKCFKR